MYILFVNASAANLDSYPGCILDRAGAVALEGPVMVALDATAPRSSIADQFGSAAKPVDISSVLVRDRADLLDITASRERCLGLMPAIAPLSITACTMEEATVLSLCMGASLEVFTGTRGAYQSDPDMVHEAL